MSHGAESMHKNASLVPRPPLFFVLQFAFSIIHGSGRARKTGKAWEHLSRDWCQVNVGGEVPDYKYGCNKPESEFLTGQTKYLWSGQTKYSWSCECLGSCLAVERSMVKSSKLFHVFSVNPSPPLCPQCSHRPDIKAVANSLQLRKSLTAALASIHLSINSL